MMHMNLAVVIPTYNEAANVTELHHRLRDALGPEALFVFVDDGSPDSTASALRCLGDDNMIVIDRAAKLGLGSAYRDGFSVALDHGCLHIAQMDADLSHAPEELVLLKHRADHKSLIVGSRYVPGGRIVGWGPWRHFCSRSAMRFARFMLDLRAQDVTSGFRLWPADLLKRVLSSPMASDGYAFQEEMLFRAQKAGAMIIEVPITFRDRKFGQSKLRWRDVLEFFRVMTHLRRQR